MVFKVLRQETKHTRQIQNSSLGAAGAYQQEVSQNSPPKILAFASSQIIANPKFPDIEHIRYIQT